MQEETMPGEDVTEESHAGDEDIQPLFRHSKRPQWGLAILAWETPTRRHFQFQDGRLRTFKRGFEHLFEQVDKPLDVAIPVVSELESRVDRTLTRRNPRRKRLQFKEPEATFADQVVYFRDNFPEGFQDEAYVRKVREPAEGRKPRKRHRQPAIDRAQKELSKHRLDELIETGEYSKVHEAAVNLMKSTSLVTPKARKPLETLPESAHEDFAFALRALLHGEGPIFDRFARFVASLTHENSRPPRWGLCTSILALADPTEHVPVKPSTFRQQALFMAPRLRYEKQPTAGLYERYRKMVLAVKGRLEDEGLQPRDLLDVYEFIWITLRPKALKTIKTAKETAKKQDMDLSEALEQAA